MQRHCLRRDIRPERIFHLIAHAFRLAIEFRTEVDIRIAVYLVKPFKLAKQLQAHRRDAELFLRLADGRCRRRLAWFDMPAWPAKLPVVGTLSAKDAT